MTDLIEGTLEKARAAIAAHDLVAPDAAVLLMVSGGSDSTALAYLGAALREAGDVGPGGHAAREPPVARRGRRCRRALRGGFGRGAGHPAVHLLHRHRCRSRAQPRERGSRGPARALPGRQRGAALDVPARGTPPLRGAHLHGPYRRRPHRELLHALHRGHRSGRLPQHALPQRARGAPVARPYPRRVARLPVRPRVSGGDRRSATSPARSGARTPPTPTPTASAPMCATRSCRWPRNGTVRCPRC